eukprot:g33229.t1
MSEYAQDVLKEVDEQPEAVVHIDTNDISRKGEEVLQKEFGELGPDGIYPRMLKEAREEIAEALTEIFITSLAIVFFEKVTKRLLRVADVIYMDFSKAFDKVLHSRLAQKIKLHRIH